MKLDYKKDLQIAKAATQGPWIVVVDKWPHYKGGEHIERRIFTEAHDPQLKGEYPIVNSSVGLGEKKGAPPVHMVSIRENDATYIAHFDPALVAAYIKRCEELEKELTMISEVDRMHLFLDALEREQDNPEKLIWMSFCDPNLTEGNKFLGVIITKAKGLAHAVEKTHDLGINPGGEIMSFEIEDEIDIAHHDRLLSREDMKAAGFEVLSINEAEEAGLIDGED